MLSIFRDFPAPGQVFKEYIYKDKGHFAELDPNATSDGAEGQKTKLHLRAPRILNIDDLDGAVKAEAIVEYWGGHIGTTEQNFRVNRYGWIPIPQPKKTRSQPEAYYRTIWGTTPAYIPIEQLVEGENKFRFSAGPQIPYCNFYWGFYWIYNFTIRVTYDCTKKHPEASIVSPASGMKIGDTVEFKAVVGSSEKQIKKVDYIGYYEDFDYRGMGDYKQWQYQYRYGNYQRHIGTATEAPYSVKWDTSKIPDQSEPIKVIACITDVDGYCWMTPVIDIELERKGRSLRMYKPYEVPEIFGVRAGRRKSCKIDVNDDLSNAKAAYLVLSTWSAAHAEEIGLNDRMLVERIGVVHDYSCDEIPVPLDAIKNGTNEFYIYSSTEEHAAEVNWPGPVLMIEY